MAEERKRPDDWDCLSEAEVQQRKQWKEQHLGYKGYARGTDVEQIQQEFPPDMCVCDNNALPALQTAVHLAPSPSRDLFPGAFSPDSNFNFYYFPFRRGRKHYTSTINYLDNKYGAQKMFERYGSLPSPLNAFLEEHTKFLAQANTLANVLSEPHRTALKLFYFESLTTHDIAQQLQIEEPLIHAIISRAHAQLVANYICSNL